MTLNRLHLHSLVFALALAVGLVMSLPAPALAQDASSSTTQKLRERIEKVVEEKREQVKGAIEELTGQRRAIVGEVQRVSAEAITIKSSKATHIFPLNPDLALIKKDKAISIDDVAIGDWALVIGTANKDDFTPQRLYISDTTLRPKNKVVMLGTIKSLSKSEITIIPRGEEGEKTFSIVKGSVFQDMEGTAITTKDLEADLQCLVIGFETDKGIELKVLRSLAAKQDSP